MRKLLKVIAILILYLTLNLLIPSHLNPIHATLGCSGGMTKSQVTYTCGRNAITGFSCVKHTTSLYQACRLFTASSYSTIGEDTWEACFPYPLTETCTVTSTGCNITNRPVDSHLMECITKKYVNMGQLGYTCPCSGVNGNCGSTLNTCDAGSYSSRADTTTQYKWACNGTGGGSNASCSLWKPANCGATHSNCDLGVSSSSPADTATEWKWTCTNGTRSLTCSEWKPPACGSAHYGCSVGSSSGNVETLTNYKWTCSNGGANISCTEVKLPWNLTAHVFIDNNGNGSQAAPDPDLDYKNSANTIIRFTGNKIADRMTDGNGDTLMLSVAAGTSEKAEIIIPNLPAGWIVSPGTLNPSQDKIGPPPSSQVVNFGIKPAAPTCNGGLNLTGLTATGALGPGIFQGQSVTVSCVTPNSPSGQAIAYRWTVMSNPAYNPPIPPVTVGTITTGAVTSTYSAPANARPSAFIANANLEACNPGPDDGTFQVSCTPYSIRIPVYPLYSISGYLFNDLDKSKTKNGIETEYTAKALGVGINFAGNITTNSPAPVLLNNPSAGKFLINNLPAGTYTVSYDLSGSYPQSQGFLLTTPPSYSVKVGGAIPCLPTISTNPPCLATGDVSPVGFGITNSVPWIQSVGGDFYQNPFNNPVPVNASTTAPYAGGGRYSSVNGTGNTPGIIYSGGIATPSFGPSGSTASIPNWVIGGIQYPEIYATNGVGLKTSYGNIDSLIDKYGKRGEVKPLSASCNLLGCDLTTIASGIYTSGNSSVTLIASTISGSKNLIILVNNDLNITGKILVANGSTLFITASGNINVDSGVGESTVSSYCKAPQGANALSSGDPDPNSSCSIEGYYSSDHGFNVNGNGASLCPIADKRLNIGGSIVANALRVIGGGGIGINRDLCEDGAVYPVLSITERPDFILNSPQFFMTKRRVWQEVAP